MSSISDIIEHYLKQVLAQADAGIIEVKRSELADSFQCVPSQINYVIQTRFTLEKGYVVESKRGGSGFIRIQKIPLTLKDENVLQTLLNTISQSIPQSVAENVINRLLEENLMDEREATLMSKLISRDVLKLPIPLRDEVRARLMRIMVTTVFASKGE